MTDFRTVFDRYDWNSVTMDILNKTDEEVRVALQKENCDMEDFKAFLSPAAKKYLEQMAQKSQQRTRKRFGDTIQMYVPLYLSNECTNICTYCGFSFTNKIPRRTLSNQEILQEAFFLKSKGYDHILIVTGEANATVGVSYIKNAIKLIRPYFSNISIEVQPLSTKDYEDLRKCGLYGVLVYQETYARETYKKYHPKGKKSNFYHRLNTPDRLGSAGIHKIGLGALLGLENWRTDSFYTALHLRYLQKKYWKTSYSISFPRLRPHKGGIVPKMEMEDTDLTQLICAYRLLDETVELSLSTREREVFRDHAILFGITSISAESKTNPGGYTVAPQSLEQFEISDQRSTEEIIKMIRKQGKEVVWKNWEHTKAVQHISPSLS